MGDRPATATNGPVPQHHTQRFDLDSVVFTSYFDSGNLGRVEKAAPEVYHVWTAPDCADTAAEATCRSWFYFKVTAPKGVMLTIVVKNLNLQKPAPHCPHGSHFERVGPVLTSQRGAGVRDRSTLRLVITRSVTLRNTLIYNEGAERTRLIMDIHTGAQTKNEKRVWPLLETHFNPRPLERQQAHPRHHRRRQSPRRI